MRLVPYSREVEKPMNDMFSMMDEFFHNSLTQVEKTRGFRLNIIEEDQSYTVEGELPGVLRENIEIAYENNLLKISVKQEEAGNEKKYLHKEIKTYDMERVMRFKNIDEEKISAKLENGILTVTLAKKDLVDNKRKIEIQ